MEKSLTEIKRIKKKSSNNNEELNQKSKKSEKKYYALFNNSTSGIAYHKIIYDSKGKPINYIITDVNPQYELILSIKKEDVINKTATESYKVKEAPYLDIYSKVAETQKSCSFEAFFQPLDTYFKITVISPEKGEFMTVFDDITKQKKLLDSEEKYRLITENANDLICIINKNYKYEYINEKTYLRVLGYTNDDLIGKSALKLGHPKDFENFISSFWAKDEIDDRTVELRVKHKNGKWIWLNINIQRFYNEKNEKKFLLVSREITFRKLAEKKIKESEQKYRHLFEDSPFAIALINFEGEILECNSYVEQLLGFKKEELARKDFKLINLVSEGSLPLVLNSFKRLIRGDIPKPERIELFRNDGSLIWVLLHTSLIKLKGMKFIQVIVENITERKEIEEKLRESEENYRELVNSANSIILRWDIEGRINFINEFGETFFGYSKSGLFGKHVIGTIVPKTETTGRDLVKLMEDICKDPERYKNNVNENITKYGRKVWISWTNKAIKDDQGNLIGILSVGNDITKQRLATLKISESEEKFRTITEQSFIGIAIIDNFKFKYVNQQFADTLGFTLKEILKWKPKEFFRFIHPEDRNRILEIAETDYFGKNEILAGLQFRALKKTGEVIWLEIISKKITFEGKAADLIATLDITEKKEAERLVLEENRKLVDLNKMRKDIITRVSHELKTPITSIYGASQILLKHFEGEIDDEALKFIEIFHRGALRLKKLVENLIDASRIESGKLELNIKMNDLVKITKECVEEMSYLLNSRKLNVKLNLPEKLELNVDKIRLQQVITNLLSNAIKNTPIGGIIYININDNHDFNDIQIIDKGIGITEKEKGLLFEKFGKMERYGMDLGVDIEGSGLGLYISKEIVELHGGQILVESEGRNKGSTFTIRLY